MTGYDITVRETPADHRVTVSIPWYNKYRIFIKLMMHHKNLKKPRNGGYRYDD